MFWKAVSRGCARWTLAAPRPRLSSYSATAIARPVNFCPCGCLPVACVSIFSHNLPLSVVHVPARHKSTTKKGSKKGGGSPTKGDKKQDEDDRLLDELLDELSDDEDEDPSAVAAGEREALGTSPAAKFMVEAQKGGSAKKDKKSPSKGWGGSLGLTYGQAMSVLDIDDYWDRLEDEAQQMKQHLAKHISVRSATAIDDLEVELEGDKFPLREIAAISKKDPKRVIVDCSAFPQAAADVMKTLQGSGMNLNPQQDGLRIYVPIPKVTKEYREKLVKGAKEILMQTKDRLRSIQNREISSIDNKSSEMSGVSKDHVQAVKGILKQMADHFMAETEVVLAHKQKEILGK